MADRENRTGIFELNLDPEIDDLFRVAFHEALLKVRTHVPATIVAVNPVPTPTVDVLVDMLAVVKDNFTPPSRINPAPTSVLPPVPLFGIPVEFLGGALGHSTIPLVPGDSGVLHVSDRALQQWLTTSVAGDPIAAWTHNLADSIFVPSKMQLLKGSPLDMTATVLDGASLIKLGAAAQPVFDNLVKNQPLITAIDSMLAAGVSAGGSGAINFTAAQTAWNFLKTSFTTTKVLGE